MELEPLKHKVHEQEGEINLLTSQLKIKESELASTQSEQNKLHDDVELIKQTNRSLINERDGLREQFNNLATDYDLLKDETVRLNKARQEVDDKQKLTETQLEKKEQEQRDLGEKYHEVISEREQLLEKIKRLEQELNAEKNKSTQSINQKDEQISSLTEELEAVKSESITLGETLKNVEDELKKFQPETDAQDDKHKDEVEDFQTRGLPVFIELLAKRDELSQQLLKEQKEHEASIDNTLKVHNALLKKKDEDFEEEKNKALNEIEQKYQVEVTSLQKQLEDVKTKSEEKEAEFKELNEAHSEDLKNLEEMKELRQQLSKATQEAKAHKEEKESFENRVAALTSEHQTQLEKQKEELEEIKLKEADELKEHHKEELDKQKEELEEQHGKAVEELNHDLTLAKEKHEAEVEKAKVEFEKQLKKEQEDRKKEVDQLSGELEELESQKKVLEELKNTEVEKLREELSSKEKDHELTIEKAREEFEEKLDEEKTSKAKEVADLKEQIESLGKEYEQNLKDQKSDFEEQLRLAGTKSETLLEHEKSERKSEVDELNKKHKKALEDSKKEYDHQLEDEKEKRVAAEELQAKEKATFQGQHDKLSETIKALSKEKDEQVEAVKQLEISEEELKKAVESLKRESQDKGSLNEKQKLLLEEKQEELNRVKDLLTNETRKTSELDEKVEQLEARIRELEGLLGSSDSEKQQVLEQIRSAEERTTKSENEWRIEKEELESENRAKVEQLAQKNKELDDVNGELRDLRKEHSSDVEKNSKLEAEVKAKDSQLSSLEKEAEKLKEELVAAEEKIPEIRRQLETTLNENKESIEKAELKHKEEVEEIRKELNTVQQKLTTASGDLEAKAELLKEKTSKVSSQEEALLKLEEDKRVLEEDRLKLISQLPNYGLNEYRLINYMHSQSEDDDSSSGVSSGDDSELTLDNISTVVIGNTTVHTRANPSDSARPLQLLESLETSLKRLKSMDVTLLDGDALNLAYVHLKKDISEAEQDLHRKFDELEEAERQRFRAGITPPCHTQLRAEKEAALKACKEKLAGYQSKFASDFPDSLKAKEVAKTIQSCVEEAEYITETLVNRELEFQNLQAGFARLQGGARKTSLHDWVYDTHISLQSLMDNRDEEVRNYVAGGYVQKCADELLEKGLQASGAGDPEAKRKAIQLYKDCMLRLLPENLPLELGAELNDHGRLYLQTVVNDRIQKLEGAEKLTTVTGEDADDVRGESGLKLARRMIMNPEICPAVITLISSLQPQHEGVTTEIDYDLASMAGMRKIRSDFGLIDMPSMEELLEAVLADLEKPASMVTNELQRQHLQSSVDRQGVPRRDKFKQRCQEFLNLEHTPDRVKHKWRGMPVDGDELKKHPHRAVLDSFKQGEVFISDDARTTVSGSNIVSERPIEGISKGVMNSFFQGVPGASLLTNSKTQQQSIQITKGRSQPADVVFKCHPVTGKWQVNLANSLWTVDPAFILDYPACEIPFENISGDIPQRDWIPLISPAGEKTILVLRKVPGDCRFFLYGKAGNDRLVPKVLGGGKPEDERIQAQFLYNSALLAKGQLAVGKSGAEYDDQVNKLWGARVSWLPANKVSKEELQTVYEQSVQQVKHHSPVCPVECQLSTTLLDSQGILPGVYRKVQLKKEGRSKNAQDYGLGDSGAGRKRVEYTPELFGRFSVEATFDQVGACYLKQCQQALKQESKLLAEEAKDREIYAKGVYRQMSVFNGCELNATKIQSKGSEKLVPGTPAYALEVLDKVRHVNRSHCMRLSQELESDRSWLVEKLRETNTGELATYTDDELLTFAITQFEQGKLPKEVAPATDFATRLTNMMLVRNDLVQSTATENELVKLAQSLKKLDRDAELLANTPEYTLRCQNWNLDMALIASRQEAVNQRLNSYQAHTMDSGTRAKLSFECRMGTVLRENQVEEVDEGLEQITQAMDTPDGTMSRISKKGTGWGKSTVVQLFTDHACSHNLGRADRSVLVIAPETNLADLNHTLGRYYAQKGRDYQSLDLSMVYAGRTEWWTPQRLEKIHNTLLGLPEDTRPEDREEAVKIIRAPVGVSVRDVQVLMQLRAQLQNAEKTTANRQALAKMDEIADLFRNSMTFMDEWDSTVMPPRKEDLQGLVTDVNSALRKLNQNVSPEAIMLSQGKFIKSCRRKHLLSATVGSGYTAAVASGVTNPIEIKSACHVDPFTTDQRFWSWMNSATPVYTRSDTEESRGEVIQQVVDEVGSDREILIFDGREDGDDMPKRAMKDYKLLSEARGGNQKTSRGILFYDDKKRLHMYQKGDAVYGVEGGAVVPGEEKPFLRADVCMGKKQSVGTDAPQKSSSVGIYMGLLEQTEEGRTSYVAQQVGRLMRASNPRKNQKLYIAVDVDAAKKLTFSDQTDASVLQKQFSDAHSLLEKTETDLKNSLPYKFNECTQKQKAAIYTPLHVPPLDSDVKGNIDELMEKTMVAEVSRLSDEVWSKAGFSEEQLEALKNYKRQQWRTKKAWLLLSAAELARREISEHTLMCEKLLQKASVESHLDQVFSEEQAWLHSGVKELQKDFKFDCQAPGMKAFANPRVERHVRESVLAEANNRLAAIQRRVSSAGGDIDKVPEQINPDLVTDQIEKQLDDIKKQGVELAVSDEFDVSCEQLPMEGGHHPSIREAITRESVKSLDEAIQQVNKVIQSLPHRGVIGMKKLEELRDQLVVSRKKVTEKSMDGIAEAIATPQRINEVYRSLAERLQWIGLDPNKFGNSFCQGTYLRHALESARKIFKVPGGYTIATIYSPEKSWDEDFKTDFKETSGKYEDLNIIRRQNYSGKKLRQPQAKTTLQNKRWLCKRTASKNRSESKCNQ